MAQPESNGLFEVMTSKKVKERGFNCMKLIEFLTEKRVTDWAEWHEAHVDAAQGECRYASICPIHAKTPQKPRQLKLF